ncbi:MAG: hypothetical protein ABR549_12185 [Mycobacteriales bacterium]
MTRNRFVLLAVAVVVVAFAVGLAFGLSTGSSSSGTAAGAPSPSPTATSTLPAGLVHDCTDSAGITSCQPTLGGVDEVLVKSWPDSASMLADFTRTQGGKPDGKCGSYTGDPPSGLRSTWGNGKPLACYVNSNGAAVVLWEVPDRALQLLAIRKDGDTRAAFAWWTEAIKTPL